MTSNRVLDAVLTAAGAFAASALARLSPPLVARVAGAGLSVVVRVQPPRARLIVEAPSGDTICVRQAEGSEFPADLGAATAKVLEDGLSRLSAPARTQIAALVTAGVAGLA